jgi:molybdopterin-biosynthesis enzyme MoeA-like protein
MTPEQYAQIGGAVVVLLGGPPAVRAGLRWIAGYIERRARARDAAEEREDERDDRTEARLWQRLDRVEAHVEECETARREDARECAQRVSSLEQRVTAAEAAAKKAAADVTQRIDIAAEKVVARRSPPPPRPRGETR